MASLLAKLAVSNRSLAVFLPVITASRFFTTKPLDDTVDNIPTFNRTCQPFIRDLIKGAHCPHDSAVHNMSCLLDLMDDQIGVKHTPHGFHRWYVGENEEGLFLLRGMYGLYERDVKESVPTMDLESLLHLMHFDTPCPNWDVIKEAKELNQFVESTIGMHVISSVRVFCTMRYIPAIYIVVGHGGPNPWDPYGGYVTKISLPRKFYKIEDVYTEINLETLKITIPKKKNKKPIYKIVGDFLLFREKKN